MKRLVILLIAAAGSFALAAGTRAQAPATSATKASTAPPAATADSSHPTISGVWFMHGSMVAAIVPQQDAPMLPSAVEKLKASKQQIDPELHCFPQACRASG